MKKEKMTAAQIKNEIIDLWNHRVTLPKA